MPILYVVDQTSALLVFAWACWCIYSPRYDDGVCGRLFFSITALSAFVVATRLGDCMAHRYAEAGINFGVALIGVRHFLIVHGAPERLGRFLRNEASKCQR